MKQEYRVAIVGCGGRFAMHRDAYGHITNARVVACCDRIEERAQKRAAEAGVKPYTDAAAMLAAEKPDLVHLVTPPVGRVELLTLVSDAGVPACTVEKPLATNVADWRRLCALEARTRTKFAVCHQFRWQQHLVKCQQALRSGLLGEVKVVDMSAGMNITGQGTHTLNYGFSLNGNAPVVRVFGNVSGFENSDPTHPAPERSEAYLNFANGARGLWTSGSVSPRCGDPNTVWQHVRVAAYAERGRVNYEEFGRWEIVGPQGSEEGTFGDMKTWKANNILAQAEFHKAMLRWIEDPAQMPGTHFKQSLHECAVVLALYQSALERRPVELADFDPPDDLFEQLVKVLKAAAPLRTV